MSYKYENFKRTGVFENGITVDELIENLEDYKQFYGGNRPIHFHLDGDSEELNVQFDYFENMLTINVEED